MFNLLISAMTEVLGLCLILHREFVSIFHASGDLSQQRKEGEMEGVRGGEVHLHEELTLLTIVLL